MSASVDEQTEKARKDYIELKLVHYKYWIAKEGFSFHFNCLLGWAFFVLSTNTPHLPVDPTRPVYTLAVRLLLIAFLAAGAASAGVLVYRARKEKKDLYARSVMYALRGPKADDFDDSGVYDV